MIDFVSIPPIFENPIEGCHENHACSHSKYQIRFWITLFRIQRLPMNNLAPMRNCPGGGGKIS